MLGWKRGNATSNSRILILCLSRITTGSTILWTWTKNRWSRRDATAILTAVGTTPTATGWCACCFNMMRMREIQPVPCKRVSTYILGFWYACCFIKIRVSSLKKNWFLLWKSYSIESLFSTYVLDSTNLGMARVKQQLNKCSVRHSQQSQHRTSIITLVTEIVNIQKTYRENEDILWYAAVDYGTILSTFCRNLLSPPLGQ